MPGADGRAMMAYVFLGAQSEPDGAELRERLSARFRNAPSDLDPGVIGNMAIFFADGAMCVCVYVEAPCPISQNDLAIVDAWYWPKAWETISAHKAHMVMFVVGNDDPKTRAVLLAQLAAAVVEATSSALGIYWAPSDSVWPASFMPQLAPVGRTTVPVAPCVSVVLTREPGSGVSACTRGLASFGLMEIESEDFPGTIEQLVERLMALAGYLIEAGPVIADGDTIGPDAATRTLVRHCKSRFCPGKTVYKMLNTARDEAGF